MNRFYVPTALIDSVILMTWSSYKHEPDEVSINPPPPPLATADIQLVYKWIQHGTQNLYCDEICDSVNFTYSQTIWAGIIQNTCYGCHNGTSASGGIHLENYNDITAAAKIPEGQQGSLYGAISHDPGNSAMPKSGAKLPDCNILKIKTWSDNGAGNN